MEKIVKELVWFMKQSANTFASIIKVLIKSKSSKGFPMAASSSAIVLGNGPSLRTSLEKYPAFFHQHPLIAVNSFSITPEYSLLKPTYYVVLDPGFWFGDSEVVTNTIKGLVEKTSWPLNLMVPHLAKKSPLFATLEKQNPNIKLVYFNYTVYKGFKGIGHWLYRKNMAMPQSQNVMVASLFLALNIGFKEVYLFGADHTWHESLMVNNENVVCFKDSHFYEGTEKTTYRPFYKGIHLKETFTSEEVFVTFSKIFKGYMQVEHYSKYLGSKIYNASEVSFIDAFERTKPSTQQST